MAFLSSLCPGELLHQSDGDLIGNPFPWRFGLTILATIEIQACNSSMQLLLMWETERRASPLNGAARMERLPWVFSGLCGLSHESHKLLQQTACGLAAPTIALIVKKSLRLKQVGCGCPQPAPPAPLVQVPKCNAIFIDDTEMSYYLHLSIVVR
uniref:Uncharacterized protein n=1 Tax=Setaria viridis TaxID=4556 RepID=A0A4U6UG82_SETVI|nr:hypothetical protein SEVIR_5G218500v2 [Setaria viridis]